MRRASRRWRSVGASAPAGSRELAAGATGGAGAGQHQGQQGGNVPAIPGGGEGVGTYD